MEFLDKEKLKIRNAKKDRSIYLYTTIVLIPCFLWMVAAFVSAFIPAYFIQDAEGKISVSKIGYFLSYSSYGARPSSTDFQFGWLNVLNLCFCIGISILLILVWYLNFFQAKKTIMNRYGYVMCFSIIASLILANIFGQLAGRAANDPDYYDSFFPIFFMAVKNSDGTFLYQWNESGITMLSFNVLGLISTLTMLPFWIVVANKTGRITKNTSKMMLLRDDTSKMILARDIVKDQPHQN